MSFCLHVYDKTCISVFTVVVGKTIRVFVTIIVIFSQSASVNMVSLRGRFYLHVGMSQKFMCVCGND